MGGSNRAVERGQVDMAQIGEKKDLCKFSSVCDFFLEKMQNNSPLKDYFKVDFCVRAPQFCARYIICSTIGMGSVPKDLMPYEIQRVKELLS